jgi:hypothetical protein
MRELIIIISIVTISSFWVLVGRHFPNTRVPLLYQEKLWLHVITNLVFVTVMALIFWRFWL